MTKGYPKMTKTTILAGLCAFLFSVSACQAAPQADAHTTSLAGLSDDHLDRSIAQCNNALGKNPRHIQALLERSQAYALTNRFDKAISDCDAVLRIDRKNGEAYFQRGLYRGFSGGSGSLIFDVPAARADLEKAALFCTDANRRAEISEILSYHQEAQEQHEKKIASSAPSTTVLREVHQSGLRIRPAIAIRQKASTLADARP